jgi:hypothetical protein
MRSSEADAPLLASAMSYAGGDPCEKRVALQKSVNGVGGFHEVVQSLLDARGGDAT